MGVLISSSSTGLPTWKAPARSPAPQLPAGFNDTFTSRYIDAGRLRQPAVIEGDGPPLLQVYLSPKRAVA